jgi:hypothetical protein
MVAFGKMGGNRETRKKRGAIDQTLLSQNSLYCIKKQCYAQAFKRYFLLFFSRLSVNRR